MWIVNWSRLLIFAAVVAAIYVVWKGLYAVTEQTPWPAFALIVTGLLGAWLIDRRNKG